jgi:hypothetical protein
MSYQKEGYLGNKNLKAAGTKIEFTKEQVEEYMKCAKDPIYFIKNYVRIVSLDHGLVPFDLYDFQEDIVNKVHDNRFVIAKLPFAVPDDPIAAAHSELLEAGAGPFYGNQRARCRAKIGAGQWPLVANRG